MVHVHAGPVGKLEAKPGARRIRRTIKFPLASGEQATRQVIITDPEKARVLLMAAWLQKLPAKGLRKSSQHHLLIVKISARLAAANTGLRRRFPVLYPSDNVGHTHEIICAACRWLYSICCTATRLGVLAGAQ